MRAGTMWDMLKRQDEIMFSGFTAEERDRLDEYLLRIYDNLNSMH